jgi:hypothetical protein
MFDIEEIKRTLTMIDDPRLEILRYPLVHRSLVLTVLAYEHGQGGLLPPLADCAAHLQISVKNLKKTLHKLNKLGWVHATPQGWVATRLQENPASSGREVPVRYARQRHASAAQRRAQTDGASKQAIPYYD